MPNPAPLWVVLAGDDPSNIVGAAGDVIVRPGVDPRKITNDSSAKANGAGGWVLPLVYSLRELWNSKGLGLNGGWLYRKVTNRDDYLAYRPKKKRAKVLGWRMIDDLDAVPKEGDIVGYVDTMAGQIPEKATSVSAFSEGRSYGIYITNWPSTLQNIRAHIGGARTHEIVIWTKNDEVEAEEALDERAPDERGGMWTRLDPKDENIKIEEGDVVGYWHADPAMITVQGNKGTGAYNFMKDKSTGFLIRPTSTYIGQTLLYVKTDVEKKDAVLFRFVKEGAAQREEWAWHVRWRREKVEVPEVAPDPNAAHAVEVPAQAPAPHWDMVDDRHGGYNPDFVIAEKGNVLAPFGVDPNSISEGWSFGDFISKRTNGYIVREGAIGMSLARLRLSSGYPASILWRKVVVNQGANPPVAPIAPPAQREVAPGWMVVPGHHNPNEVICKYGDVFGDPDIDPSTIFNNMFEDYARNRSLGVCIGGAAGLSVAGLRHDTEHPNGVLFRPTRVAPRPFNPTNPIFLSFPHYMNGVWKELDAHLDLLWERPELPREMIMSSRFINWKPSFHGQEAPLP